MMIKQHLGAVSGATLLVALVPAAAQAADLVQTLKDHGQFSELVGAIEQAGLTQSLQGEGPYTVFAPTDEAFGKLPEGAVDQLAQGDGQLGDVLKHHVVEGKKIMAKDILGQETKVSTLSGDQLTVDGTGAMVVLVPTGLQIARVGDQIFVQREVGALAAPAVTVSTTGQDQQGATSGQRDQQQQQAGTSASGSQQQATTGGGAGQDQQQTAGTQNPEAAAGQQAATGGQQDQQQAATAASGSQQQATAGGGAGQDQQQTTGTQNPEAAAGQEAATGAQQDQQQQQAATSASGSQQQATTGGGAGQDQEQTTGTQNPEAAAGEQLTAEERSPAAQQAQQGQQGGDAGQGQPMEQQQGMLRAAMVVEPDIQADNGVIHAIDEVLVPQKIEQQLGQAGSQQGGSNQ